MYYSIYFSPTGGTKKVADILTNHLDGDFVGVDLCRDINPLELTAEDICLISVPSFGGRVPAVNVERLKKIAGNGARAILNCVYGNRHWDDTLTELQDILEECGFLCIAAIAAVAEHSIFRQFATGRPDEDDKKQLTGFVKEIQQKLDGGSDRLELVGSHGTYKEYNGVPFKPEANEDCTLCGLCAKECPVAAINPENPKVTDHEACISCMRCISLCLVHARDLDAELLKTKGEAIAPHLSGRKENHLFL